MSKWFKFWQNYRLIQIKNDNDLLHQVGKTVNKKPISKHQLHIIVNSIVKNLNLNQNDILLDLCCGNGMLTFELSKYVKRVIGVDFSKPFIKNAKLYKNAKNIEYINHDILNIKELLIFNRNEISKVLLYDALAYFKIRQLAQILYDLLHVSKSVKKIFLGSILYKKFRWKFFNSWKRVMNYYVNIKFFNNKGLGTWWSDKSIKILSKKVGFNYKIIFQDKRLYTSHYRVDILIDK